MAETETTTAARLLKVIDDAIKPREIPRVTPPEPPQPTARVRVVRSVIVGGGYLGADVRVGDIIQLSAPEIYSAVVCQGWGELLEPLVKPTGTELYYAD